MAEEERLSDGKPSQTTIEERLESWKEIAAFLKRDVRTVQRWEKREGLPVHRHQHERLGSVYAYKSQLDAWWRNGHERLEDEQANALAGRTADVLAPSEIRSYGRILWISALVCLVVLGSLFALDMLGLMPANLWQRLSGKGSVAQIRSIAVLPLKNLSGDAAQEAFADSMTEELIRELSRIRALNVISWTSVIRYKQTDKPLPQIARELGLDTIVEGSIWRSHDSVRITAQLMYAPRDTNLWTQTYERDLQDTLTLQSIVARAIAEEIHVKVTREEEVKLKKVRPVNPRALDAYVEARFHLDQVGNLEFYRDKQQALQEELHKAVSNLDRAIQEDPHYIPPYLAYFDAVDSPNASRLDLLPRAKTALTKALELDETNLEAHLKRARLLIRYEYGWAGAEQEYKRALELNPNSADAHSRYADYLWDIGRDKDSDKERDRAQALDPAQDYFLGTGVHRIKGQTLEGERQALEEKAPNDPFGIQTLAKSYAIAGRYKESVEMWERSLALYEWHDFVEVLKRADAQGGPKFALEEWMRAAEEYSKKQDDFPVLVAASTYSSLGNKDRAFAWLDKAYTQRNWCIIALKKDNAWDPLRSDNRFADLMRRVGLPK